MKRLAEESNRFRVEDIPPRLREKEKLFAVFKDLERQMRDMNFELDRDLYPDSIERSWSQLMMLYQVIFLLKNKQNDTKMVKWNRQIMFDIFPTNELQLAGV